MQKVYIINSWTFMKVSFVVQEYSWTVHDRTYFFVNDHSWTIHECSWTVHDHLTGACRSKNVYTLYRLEQKGLHTLNLNHSCNNSVSCLFSRFLFNFFTCSGCSIHCSWCPWSISDSFGSTTRLTMLRCHNVECYVAATKKCGLPVTLPQRCM